MLLKHYSPLLPTYMLCEEGEPVVNIGPLSEAAIIDFGGQFI